MSNSKNLYEIALKISSDSVVAENAIANHSISGILNEALDDKDVQKLRTAVKQSLKGIEGSMAVAKQFSLPALGQYFESIKKSLMKADSLVTSLDLADPEGVVDKVKGFFGKKVSVHRALAAVMDLQNKVNVAIDSTATALELIIANLEGKDIDEEMVLNSLEQEKHGIGADQVRAGVSKAFKSVKPSGFMAKLTGILAKEKFPPIPGAEDIGSLPGEEIADDILSLNLKQLKGGADQAEAAADTAEDAQVAPDAIADITADEPTVAAGGMAPEEGGDPEAEADPAKEIAAAAAAAASKPMTPKDAVGKALDDWEASLSASSQKTLQAKKRNQALKDAVFTGIDKGKKSVQRAVSKAVKSWRADNEEILIKSKRFAKKNFDSLQKMIPQLAAQVLSQSNENRRKKITQNEINKFVHKKLNEKFYISNKLYETWQKNAGLLRD